jgi:hypothetical protein
MEKLISQIALMLKTEMSASELFPYSDRKLNPTKNQFKPHMKTIALDKNPIIPLSPTMHYFELGNDYSEEKAPYYHILEDAKQIRNPYASTKRTRGFQAFEPNKRKRDYSTNTYYKDTTGKNVYGNEYRYAFRPGRRSYVGQQMNLVQKRFDTRNQKKPFRYNIHFAYIERILEKIVPYIADFLGLKVYSGLGLITSENPANYVSQEDIVNTAPTQFINPLNE